jgi:hypothetical protein
VRVMTTTEQKLWQANTELARFALDALDRMVIPRNEENKDLAVARARIENWIAENEGRWVTGS